MQPYALMRFNEKIMIGTMCEIETYMLIKGIRLGYDGYSVLKVTSL